MNLNKLSGRSVKPHLVKIGGLWRVRARSPWRGGHVRLEAVHFMTANSKRFHDAKVWAACRNARLVAAGAAKREAALVARSLK